MGITIEQALQQGISAHEAGKFQEAEKLYRAILNNQSNHPDANHNMGLIAIDIGEIEQSLLFFERALESNKSILLV